MWEDEDMKIFTSGSATVQSRLSVCTTVCTTVSTTFCTTVILTVSQVLKVGGKFLFVMPTGETLGPRIVYEEMKREERWRELLEKTR